MRTWKADLVGRVTAKELDFGSLLSGLFPPSCFPHFYTVVPVQVQSMRSSNGSGETREERNWGSYHL